MGNGNGVDLVSLIDTAGDAELQKISEEILRLEREIREFTESRRCRIQSLTILKRAIKAKLYPIKRKHGKQNDEGTTTYIRSRVYDLLAAEGSMPVPAIAKRLGLKPSQVGASIWNCDWFDRRDGEVHIATTKGRAKPAQ